MKTVPDVSLMELIKLKRRCTLINTITRTQMSYDNIILQEGGEKKFNSNENLYVNRV